MKNWENPEINCVNIADTESNLLGRGGDGVVYESIQIGDILITGEGGTESRCNTGSRVKFWKIGDCEMAS